MASFGGRVSVLKEVVGHLRGTSHFACARKAEDQEIEHQAVVLEHEGRELKTANETVRVRVRHVLVRENWKQQVRTCNNTISQMSSPVLFFAVM